MKTIQKVVFWLIKSGYTAEDVLWWEIGYRQTPRKDSDELNFDDVTSFRVDDDGI